jgi:hypothetical protein
MMPVDQTELRDELTLDPASIGYAGMSNSQKEDAINLERDTIDVDRTSVSTVELQSAVVGTEYVALTISEQNAWNAILIVGSGAEGSGIPLDNAAIRAQVAAIWDGGTTTRGNLQALQTTKGSRAEQLWGEGTRVTRHEIAEALA